MLKPFVLHGVGTAAFYDLSTGREVMRVLKQETASWLLSFDEVEVSGGDDLDLFEVFETGRAQSVSFTDNQFDMRQLELSTGARPYVHYSAPIVEFDEGGYVPDTGPYTFALDKGASVDDSTVRLRFSETFEDMAPVPQTWSAANLAEVTGATFTLADSIDVRITAVLPSGIESCASAVANIVIGAATGDVEVTLPANVLDIPSALPMYDVEISGFNIYVDDGTAAEYKSNATPIAAGGTHTLLATPGAGAGSPDTTPTVTGQYTVSGGTITFASADAGVGFLTDYVWTTSASIAQAETVDVKTNCLRRWLKCIWKMKYNTNDGITMGLQAVIHRMKYTGDYTLDFNRSDASSHDLEFKIINPERPDRKIVSWTAVNLGATEIC